MTTPGSTSARATATAINVGSAELVDLDVLTRTAEVVTGIMGERWGLGHESGGPLDSSDVPTLNGGSGVSVGLGDLLVAWNLASGGAIGMPREVLNLFQTGGTAGENVVPINHAAEPPRRVEAAIKTRGAGWRRARFPDCQGADEFRAKKPWSAWVLAGLKATFVGPAGERGMGARRRRSQGSCWLDARSIAPRSRLHSARRQNRKDLEQGDPNWRFRAGDSWNARVAATLPMAIGPRRDR